MAGGIVMKSGHKPIADTAYAVSADGRAWSYMSRNGRGTKIHPHQLPQRMLKGAPVVNVGRDKTFLDILIAESFIGPRPTDSSILEFINGDDSDCSASNMQWVESEPLFPIKGIQSAPGYFAGQDGSIWSRASRHQSRFGGAWFELKPSIRSHGYCGVNIHGRIRYVHELVLEAWVGPRPDGYECCHGDGIKTNNRLSNLRWDTRKANGQDRIKHGTAIGHTAKLTHDMVLEVRSLAADGVPEAEIATRFGLHRNHVKGIVRRRYWKNIPPADRPPPAPRPGDLQ